MPARRPGARNAWSEKDRYCHLIGRGQTAIGGRGRGEERESDSFGEGSRGGAEKMLAKGREKVEF